jgi:Lrp/AsnC family transcriptional regulator, leucine-responsive regulatory protein
MHIDETDCAILRLLQHNARISNAEIARQVGLVPSAIFQRIRKLEQAGVVQGYRCELNARAVGCGLVAFIMIQTRDGALDNTIGPSLAALSEVQEVHRVVGNDCFIAKVRVRDTDALAHLLEHTLPRIGSVGSTRTTIVVKTLKETLELPVVAGS